MVTLDVKNAFNTVRWNDIIQTLEERFRVPDYIVRIVSDYLSDRKLIYETTDGTRMRKITSGVAQGSALGPDLWNAVYDDILTMEMPDGVKLVGFADDLAAVVTARTEEQARRRVMWACRLVNDWLDQRGLQLAADKTEMVVLTRQRWFPSDFRIEINGVPIKSTKAVRYLGLSIDAKLTY